MWMKSLEDVSGEFVDVTWDKMLVDAMTVRMTLDPKSRHHRRHNLHADILSDLAGALLAYRAAPTVDPENRFPSMFEPIHGRVRHYCAGIANPWPPSDSVQMLEHLGLRRGAASDGGC